MRIEKSEEIARSPEDVWAFIADARNDPQWCPKVDLVEQVAGGEPGPDAKYRVLHRPRPRKPPVELWMEVVEFDPPRRLRWREEDTDGVFDVIYELEPVETGTRLIQVDEIEWKGSKLALPAARYLVGRDIARQLTSLKRILEAS